MCLATAWLGARTVQTVRLWSDHWSHQQEVGHWRPTVASLFTSPSSSSGHRNVVHEPGVLRLPAELQQEARENAGVLQGEDRAPLGSANRRVQLSVASDLRPLTVSSPSGHTGVHRQPPAGAVPGRGSAPAREGWEDLDAC